MAPPAKENSSNGRRKSLNLFSRASLSNLTQINTGVPSGNGSTTGIEKKNSKKLAKRTSIFGSGSGSSSNPDFLQDAPASPLGGNHGPDSPKSRPRTLQKGRPSSLFGSLGKRS